MDADRPSFERGLSEFWEAGAAAGVEGAGVGSCSAEVTVGCRAFSDGVVAGTSSVAVRGAGAGVGVGVGFGTGVELPTVRPAAGAAPPPPRRLPSKTFKLFSSVPSSFNRFSLPSRAPSRALGIASFNDFTSSLIRRVSSSLRRDDVFRSETRFSTSLRAASRRSVRASSAALRAAVSVESWSIKPNARENCSSIFSLSCSS